MSEQPIWTEASVCISTFTSYHDHGSWKQTESYLSQKLAVIVDRQGAVGSRIINAGDGGAEYTTQVYKMHCTVHKDNKLVRVFHDL